MKPRHDPIDEVITSLRKSLDRALDERDAALRCEIEAEQARDLNSELALRFESELEEQRRELARQLNHDIGRHAVAIRTMAATLEHRLAGQEPSLVQMASLLLRGTDALCDAVRTMVRKVRPEALEFGGLLEGLRALVADWRLRAPHQRFELLAEPDDNVAFGLGPSVVESLAYALVEAAIESAVAEGGAGLVLVSARRGDASITLQVSDDGGRADARALTRSAAFESLRTRVLQAGGQTRIGAGEAGGVEVLVTLPWPQV